jgi:hypothetical protein
VPDDRTNLDPDHGQTRRSINTVALVLLIVGGPCAVVGLLLFLSVFFTSLNEFMTSPADAMGAIIHHGVVGIVLLSVGSAIVRYGLRTFFVANIGRIARYEAQEGLPVAKDMIRDLTPTIARTVQEISAAKRYGDEPRRFCDQCGGAAAPTAKFCQDCGAKLGERKT